MSITKLELSQEQRENIGSMIKHLTTEKIAKGVKKGIVEGFESEYGTFIMLTIKAKNLSFTKEKWMTVALDSFGGGISDMNFGSLLISKYLEEKEKQKIRSQVV